MDAKFGKMIHTLFSSLIMSVLIASATPIGAPFAAAASGRPDNAQTRQSRSQGEAVTAVMEWINFLGQDEQGVHEARGVAVDTSGNVYVTGTSDTSWGSPVRAYVEAGDAFVAKVSPSGGILWNTFLGGSGSNSGWSTAVDGAGNVYVMGDGGPWAETPVRAYAADVDVFVAKLNATTGQLIWHSFLGGTGEDKSGRLVSDPSGNLYLTGHSATAWGCAPTACTRRAYIGGYDAFVAKMDSGGHLVWNTFLGGGTQDEGTGIALAASGNLYVTGYSDASWGGPIRGFVGAYDAFAAKLSGSGTFLWNTFLGGEGDDYGNGVALDSVENLYITGTSSATWGAPTGTYTAGLDAFAAKLAPGGLLAWNTFLGGTGDDYGASVTTDASGNSYVVGSSNEAWGTPVWNYGAMKDAVVSELNTAGVLMWNGFVRDPGNIPSYLPSDDIALGVAITRNGRLYIVGSTQSFCATQCGLVVAYSLPRLAANPTSWDYGLLKAGTISAGKVFTIRNTGSANLVIGTVALGGTNPGQFRIMANGCSAHTLAPSASCTVTVAFKPTSAGIKIAEINIPDNAAGNPHKIPLKGRGGNELVLNGGFNAYATSTSRIPSSWVAVRFGAADGRDTAVMREGTASVRISNTAAVVKTLTQTRIISGVAGNVLQLSLWVKGQGIPTTGVVRAEVFLYNGATLVQTKTITLANGTYDWKPRSAMFTALATYNKVVVRLTYSKASGTVWFDGVSLLKTAK